MNGTTTPPPDDLSFLGLDAEKTAKMKAAIAHAVADGMAQGADRINEQYGAWLKAGVIGDVAAPVVGLLILAVLLLKD